MNGYSFFAPTKVLFGAGKLGELGAQKLPGTKALIVTTGGNSVKRFGYLGRLEAELDRAGVSHELFDRIEPNPLRETVNAGGWMARTHGCDFVLALGGGSVMDTAKAIGIIINNPEFADVRSLEGVAPTKQHAVFTIAVPTTAGTAAETNLRFFSTSVMT